MFQQFVDHYPASHTLLSGNTVIIICYPNDQQNIFLSQPRVAAREYLDLVHSNISPRVSCAARCLCYQGTTLCQV